MAYEYQDRSFTIPERIEVAHFVVARICDGCGERQEANEDRTFDDQNWMPFGVECGDDWTTEGYCRVERLFCDACVESVAETLIRIGFTSHAHGTSNWLEDLSCPGFHDPDACPQPEAMEEEDDFDLVEALKILP
jgi:hypothetical protein